MSEVDTMRWGDTQFVSLISTAAAGEGGVSRSNQMLNAHWQRPCVWRLLVSMAPQLVAGETLTFDIVILLRIGVGQANQVVPLATFSFAPPYAPVIFRDDVPAENMQLQFAIQNLSGLPTNLSDGVTVAAFTAPRAEPGGIVQIRDHMGQGVREPDRDGLPRWMPRGFDDGEVKYRP
jgi:hypothetical protein